MGTSDVSLGPATASSVASGASSGAPPAPTPARRGPSLPSLSDLARTLLVLPCLLVVVAQIAHAVPQIAHPVVDEAGVLSTEDKDKVSDELIALRERTGVQMAVLVVRTTGGVPIEDYAYETFEVWGGGSQTRNDGVLFVLALEDRRSRLEVGRGLEGLIPDSSAVGILEGLKPKLRASDYVGACLDTVAGVASLVGELTPGSEIPTPVSPGVDSHNLVPLALLSWLLGVLFMLFSNSRKSKPGKKAPKKPKSSRHAWSWNVWIARIPHLSTRLRALGLFVAGPLLMMGVLANGGDFGLAPGYLFTWYAFAAVGLIAGVGYRKGPIRAVLLTLLTLSAAVLTLEAPPEYLPDSLSIFAVVVSGATFIGFFTAFMSLDGSGGGGGGSWSSSGSTGSSGSSSSYSSGSSSSYSSSGSSSSSWSGGGGSSGGGGASSSW